MARLRTLLAADADVERALLYTLRTYGVRKYNEYAALIEDALNALVMDPKSGRHRQDVHGEAWTYHVAQRGRRAWHLLLYRILEDGNLVEVLALLHDAMDLPRHWRTRTTSR